MAYPAISDADTKTGVLTGDTDPWTITRPDNVAAGDLLLMWVAISGNRAYTVPTNWSEIVSVTGINATSALFAKKATGGEGATFSFDLAGQERGCWITCRIPAGSWYDDGTLGNGVSATGVNLGAPGPTGVDPPNHNPAWDATLETLWLVWGHRYVGTATATAAPANYTNLVALESTNADGSGIGWARRNLIADQENPGAFTFDGSGGTSSSAITAAVRPAAAATFPPQAMIL